MKKNRAPSLFSVLLIILLCVSMLAACKRIKPIQENQVARIVVWAYSYGEKQYELPSGDASRFIEIFNSSKYEGAGTGEGGTPEFGIRVYFRDGSCLHITDFGGFRKFEVFQCDPGGRNRDWYYVSSEALTAFASEMAKKIEANS